MSIRPSLMFMGLSVSFACGPVETGDSDGGSSSSTTSATDGATSTGGTASTGDASTSDGSGGTGSSGTGSSGTGSSGTGSSSGEPTTGATTGEPGAECEYPGQTKPCEENGVEGINVCYMTFYSGMRLWSVCFTEPCDAQGEARPCEGGTQYCTYNYADTKDVLFWGACVAEPKCEPGDYLDCGFGRDFPASAACITDGNGEPDWDPFACMI